MWRVRVPRTGGPSTPATLNTVPYAACGLGELLAEQGDVEGARAAYQQAIDSGDPDAGPSAASRLGWLLEQQGDVAGARAAYQQAIDSGHPREAPYAAVNLGPLLAKEGDVAGARAAYQRAIDSGDPDAAPDAVYRLGLLLAEEGDVAGARAAYQRAIDSGHPDAGPRAANNLGLLLAEEGDVAGARAAYQRAIDSGHPDAGLRAANNLGLLLAEEGDVAGARAAYQRAIDSGIPEVATPAAVNRAKLPGQRARHRTAPTTAGRVSEDRARLVLSNRERVGRGLEFLASGLGQFTGARLPTSSSGARDWAEVLAVRDRTRGVRAREYLPSDPRIQLRVMTEEWRAFKDELSPVARSYASELRDTGNRWAHGGAFSAADANRALDTMERLLIAVGATDQASHVSRIRAYPRAPLSAP